MAFRSKGHGYGVVVDETSPLFAASSREDDDEDAPAAVGAGVDGTTSAAVPVVPVPVPVPVVPPSAHSTDLPTRFSSAFVYGSTISSPPPARNAGDNGGGAIGGGGGGGGGTGLNRTPSGGYFELDGPSPLPHPQPQPQQPSRRSLAASLSAPHLPFPSVASHSSLMSLAGSIRIGMDLNGAGGEGGADEYYSFGMETYRRKRRRRGLWIKRCFIALLCVAVVGMEAMRRRVAAPEGPSPVAPSPMQQQRPPPFSTLDPVADLGLLSYTRPSISSPSSVFGTSSAALSSSSSSSMSTTSNSAKPTNAWYQNFLLLPNDTEPTVHNRAYAVPHVLDAAGPIPGVRVHPPRVIGEKKVVRVDFVERHGLTLGASAEAAKAKATKASGGGGGGGALPLPPPLSKRYEVADGRYLTPLGITLKWTDDLMMKGNNGDDESPTSSSGGIAGADSSSVSSFFEMTSPVVRGMPYATVRYRFRPRRGRRNAAHDYNNDNAGDDDDDGDANGDDSPLLLLLPAVVSEIALRSPPLIDGHVELECSSSANDPRRETTAAAGAKVSDDVRLTFDQSDFTWLVFFSRPARVTCSENRDGSGEPAFVLRVVDVVVERTKDASSTYEEEEEEEDDDDDEEFTVGEEEGDVGGAWGGMEDRGRGRRVGGGGSEEARRLTVRIALSSNCTSGRNPTYCSGGDGGVGNDDDDGSEYESLLRAHSDVYPGPETSVGYDFFSLPGKETEDEDEDDEEEEEGGAPPPGAARVKFDWDARSMSLEDGGSEIEEDDDDDDEEEVQDGGNHLLMFALPHHMDAFADSPSYGGVPDSDSDGDSPPSYAVISADDDERDDDDHGAPRHFCQPTLTGPACPFFGSTWSYVEPLPTLRFTASRPPVPEMIPTLIDALAKDIDYDIPAHYRRGAGDTYFSGKLLARLGRVLMIGEELRGLRRWWWEEEEEEDDGGGDGGEIGEHSAARDGAESPFLRRERSAAGRHRPDEDENADFPSLPLEYDLSSATSPPSDVDALANLVPSSRAAAADSSDLPPSSSFVSALERLRSGVEVWLDGSAETPFVYDAAWGGLVSCGCLFEGDTGKCRDNVNKDGQMHCPAFDDPGLNFGNGHYNDHHFHYGYHVLAAAVVARFDPEWGRRNFENVLLLVRDIATPFESTGGEGSGGGGGDHSFPPFRHKDFYAGHSWASGIDPSPPYLNGRNQESSSEAIAAYEAVGLYGDAMVRAFTASSVDDDNDGDASLIARAAHVRDAGRLLAATELRSSDRYWHVRLQGEEEDAGGDDDAGTKNGESPSSLLPVPVPPASLYPEEYDERVIGVMWNTMAQFQTWFGNDPFLAYGIQLLPLTAISEERDDLKWTKSMYPAFASSCEESAVCTEQGWSILQLAVLATVGRRSDASERALSVPPESFESAGGNGHSLTNLLWYIATRPNVDDPLPLNAERVGFGHAPGADAETDGVVPGSAKNAEEEAKAPIDEGGDNNDGDENGGVNVDVDDGDCPPCLEEICRGGSDGLGHCPVKVAPYVCTEGPSRGGCSGAPWTVSVEGDEGGPCRGCCKLGPECGDGR
eukprot:CAMPEP_0113537792 /NCGR_PEP_ID=MMETSP0015_2-20120614/7019_1 /TAXON_ID=2838 /ORGANISM="Odontella" /LENGTH=1557 /DNA_ID=CAMNT_0000437319 /DNA_START=456 /DNA_END=5129 /DNA_ORIENTATION=- /assembly_acc=CAM_ASM_000160